MNINSMTLSDYEALVRHIAKNKTDDLIDNDTVDHAEILVSELVKTAEKSIKLYTNSFCKEFYKKDKIKQAFSEAKDRNVTLKIIAETDITDNEAYKEFKTIFSDDLILKNNHSDAIIADFSSNKENLNNFMIIDDKALRYEQEKKQDICDNIKDVKARATFNRPKDVQPFINAFDIVI